MARPSGNTIPIESVIQTVRGEKIILDADLARIYGGTTKRLNEQVKRNPDRFPSDFVFRLTQAEWERLVGRIANSDRPENRSQIATGSQRHRDPPFPALCLHRARGDYGGQRAQQPPCRPDERLCSAGLRATASNDRHAQKDDVQAGRAGTKSRESQYPHQLLVRSYPAAHDPTGAQETEDRISCQRKSGKIRKARNQTEALRTLISRGKGEVKKDC